MDRQIGAAFRLSVAEQPDPSEEVHHLYERCETHGEAPLAVTRDLSALEPGALFVICADGQDAGGVLATARFRRFLDHDWGEGRELRQDDPLYSYGRPVPRGMIGFVLLAEVRLAEQGDQIDDLGAWTADGIPLRVSEVPAGSDGVTTFFVLGDRPPTASETIALLRARIRELERKTGDLRHSFGRTAALANREALRAREAGEEAQRARASEAAAQEEAKASRARRGTAKTVGRLLDEALSRAYPNLVFLPGSVEMLLKRADRDDGPEKELEQLDGMRGPPRGRPMQGRAHPWFETHFAGNDGRLYFLRQPGQPTLVLISEKTCQDRDIAELDGYARRYGGDSPRR